MSAKHLFIAGLWLFTLLSSRALTLPPVLSDGVVFQRGHPIRLWGWSTPGSTVTAELSGSSAMATTDDTGQWRIQLSARQMLSGHLLVRSSDGQSLTVRDPLLGQVWLCGGQSNMAMPLRRSDGRNQVHPITGNNTSPVIRLFRAAGGKFELPEGRWLPATVRHARAFSAICYLTGRAIGEALNEPVGLIDMSVGATRVAAWDPGASAGRTLSDQPFTRTLKNRPGYSFDTVVAPQAPFSAKGLIWYQGEGDAHREPDHYARDLVAALTAWRNQWEAPELPIALIQLPGYSLAPSPSGWKAIQRAQKTAVKQLTNAELVPAQDLTFSQLHPTEKAEISRRTARQILQRWY